MKFFFSVDWGTSAFRLRLVDAKSKTVLAEIKTEYGIATAFKCWTETNQPEKNRMAFYQAYIFVQVEKLASTFNESLSDIPVVLSGMASSSIGMMELPYKELPIRCDGSDLLLQAIPAMNENAAHKIIIISGVKSSTDVMRGEETILTGCNIENDDREQLFIFPGTHSKHILVTDNTVKNITTFITGELFNLLATKSILSASVKKDPQQDSANDGYFAEGVKSGASTNILHSIFKVRINHLFNEATAQQNYQWLSGLLIGHELKNITTNKPALITLVSSGGLEKLYMQALSTLNLNTKIVCKNADDALVNGQWKVMQRPDILCNIT